MQEATEGLHAADANCPLHFSVQVLCTLSSRWIGIILQALVLTCLLHSCRSFLKLRRSQQPPPAEPKRGGCQQLALAKEEQVVAQPPKLLVYFETFCDAAAHVQFTSLSHFLCFCGLAPGPVSNRHVEHAGFPACPVLPASVM